MLLLNKAFPKMLRSLVPLLQPQASAPKPHTAWAKEPEAGAREAFPSRRGNLREDHLGSERRVESRMEKAI